MLRSIIIFCLLLPLFTWAQGPQGEVRYASTVSFDQSVTADNPELAGLFPESQTTYMQLLFTPGATLFRQHPEDHEPEEYSGSSGEATIKIKFQRSEDVLYRNLSTGASIEKKDFMGRTFLIDQEEPTDYEWKITGEQAQIAGYLCIEAIYAEGDTNKEVVAWFAPQLPVPAGPEDYGQLPGLILKLEKDQGTQILLAEEVILREVSPEEMPKPTEGRRVTREKYDQIVEEKMKEMEMEYGSGGGVRIIRRN